MSPQSLEIEMKRMESQFLTPEEYLMLSDSDRRDIRDVSFAVAELGSGSLSATDFARIKVRWKTPRYIPRFA